MCVSVKVSADISLQPNTGTKAACVIECVLIVFYIYRACQGLYTLGTFAYSLKNAFERPKSV